MISQKILVPVLAVAVLSAGVIFTTSFVQAASDNPQSGLIQYLADKLGIDQSKIETVVNDYHTQRQQQRRLQMTENYTTYLDGLVKEGKITEDQKNAILAKHTELQQAHESADWSGKTAQERRTAMEQERTDLETWASQQGIDISYLQFGFGGFGRGGKMGDREFGGQHPEL